MGEVPSNLVKGSPVKAFFISMLNRDVSLLDAIGDLVDNSVDSAKNVSKGENYKGKTIEIDISSSGFSINDNCGGMDIEIARNYAFRFGRSSKYPGIEYSVGQFGIGMKRSLFKIAKCFEVHSKHKSSSFVLKVDIDEWANKDENDWDFEFSEFEEGLSLPENICGTKIIVTELREEVKSEFGDSNFLKRLNTEIEKENMYPISKGLKITLNGHTLKEKDLNFIVSEEIKSGFEQHNYVLEGGEVNVKIYTGISNLDLEAGGWYIFCNGRMLLGPEQTEKTGWTGREIKEGPKYHLQYARFRGYVFFESSNPSLLPWTTAKNAIDIESPIFKTVRQRMILMMKPVNNFLNSLKAEREKDSSESEWFLQQKIDGGTLLSIKSNNDLVLPYTEKTFKSPTAPAKVIDSLINIKYKKDKHKVDLVKKYFNITSNEKVGSLTFDYFFNREIDE